MLGDSNCHFGCNIIKNNHPTVNKEGLLFTQLMLERDLTFMNQDLVDPTTYTDKRTGRSRALDLVVAGPGDKITELKVEKDGSDNTPFTPYLERDGSLRKVFADHRPMTFSLEVKQKAKRTKRWKKEDSNKSTRWRTNVPMGHEKYHYHTNEAAQDLMMAVASTTSINRVADDFARAVYQAKMDSYGRVTETRKKASEFDATEIWRKRRADIARAFEKVQHDPAATQIWKTRKTILTSRRDKQMTSVMREDTGEYLEDKESIVDYLLEFNSGNMEKEEVTRDIKELEEEKKEWIRLIIEHRDRIPKEIAWEDFMRTLDKIRVQGKAVFSDFMRAGEEFKIATFLFLQRVYKEEVLPESMRVTYLTSIWKRRGDPSRLKNMRFIHNKTWLPKLFEKLIVMMVEDKIVAAAPELQAGGKPKRSTREQITKVGLLMKEYKRINKPLPLLMVDVSKFFDKCKLSDLVYDVMMAGLDPKDVKIINDFTKCTLIRMSGDSSGKGLVVMNTGGQGSVFAPMAASLSLGKSLDQQFNDFCDLARMGAIYVPPLGYIDDVLVSAHSAEGMREAAARVTRTLDTLSLKSNPDKTKLIIIGNTKDAAAMREELTRNPAQVQGHDVKISSSEPYLGFQISQKGWTDSIDKTIDMRVAKAWGRVLEIREMAKHPKMRTIGWMKTAVTMIQSLIVSSLTYSVEAWYNPLARQLDRVENNYKRIIYTILEIQKTTSFCGVLYETGLPMIREVIARQRVMFTNDLLWGQVPDNLARDMLAQDSRHHGQKSFLGEVSTLCEERQVLDVTREEAGRRTLRRTLRDAAVRRLWGMTLNTRRMTLSDRIRNSATWSQFWDKTSSRVYLFMRLGTLRFRTNWRSYYEGRGDSVLCPSDLCGTAEDTLEHMKVCGFLDNAWKQTYERNPRDMVKFLRAVSAERDRKWKCPLF